MTSARIQGPACENLLDSGLRRNDEDWSIGRFVTVVQGKVQACPDQHLLDFGLHRNDEGRDAG